MRSRGKGGRVMEASDWIGVAGLAIGVAGGVWGHLNTRISKNVAVLHQRVDRLSDAVDTKIAEIKDNYVRRDDLRDDLHRIDRGQESLAAKVDQISMQIVPSLARLASALSARGNAEGQQNEGR
jgi:hypothetical protein